MDDERYVLPDQLTFHSAVFSGCTASELISITVLWLMFWSLFLGILAFVSRWGILVIAPVLLNTFIGLFLTAFAVRRARNNRPPGALGQLAALSLDRMGLMPCRFVVDAGPFSASRSRQQVRLKDQLLDRLPREDRSPFHHIDLDTEG